MRHERIDPHNEALIEWIRRIKFKLLGAKELARSPG